MGSTIAYYRQRERQERQLAGRTNDVAARRAHLIMASRYREIVESGVVPDPRDLHRVTWGLIERE